VNTRLAQVQTYPFLASYFGVLDLRLDKTRWLKPTPPFCTKEFILVHLCRDAKCSLRSR
jgi:hypothetical protein